MRAAGYIALGEFATHVPEVLGKEIPVSTHSLVSLASFLLCSVLVTQRYSLSVMRCDTVWFAQALTDNCLKALTDSKQPELIKAKSSLLLLNLVKSSSAKQVAAITKPLIEAALKLVADTRAAATAAAPVPGDSEPLKHAFAIVRAVIGVLSPDTEPVQPFVGPLMTTLIDVLALPDAKTLETYATATPVCVPLRFCVWL